MQLGQHDLREQTNTAIMHNRWWELLVRPNLLAGPPRRDISPADSSKPSLSADGRSRSKISAPDPCHRLCGTQCIHKNKWSDFDELHAPDMRSILWLRQLLSWRKVPRVRPYIHTYIHTYIVRHRQIKVESIPSRWCGIYYLHCDLWREWKPIERTISSHMIYIRWCIVLTYPSRQQRLYYGGLALGGCQMDSLAIQTLMRQYNAMIVYVCISVCI